jgi:predicted nucleotidyltransferase
MKMNKVEELKNILAENKEKIREKYGVRILGIFGSYARGEETEISDIDILVELEKPIGLKFFELWDYLETLLGVKVDLLTTGAVRQKPLLWESIKEELIREK